MAVNKVVFGDRTVVDLTGDSVTADTMLEGVTAHDASGAVITGTAVIPTVNNGKLTIQKNGTTVATFTANQSAAATANITVPVKVSELTNDSNFVADSPAFTEASSRANIASGETFATILGKIKKFFTDLKTVAFTGSYNDLSDKPTIPTVNNATLTIQKNGTTVKTFTANASSNVTANITVPTKVSELTNDSGYTTNVGTITEIKMNGASKGTSGVVDLGTVITAHNNAVTQTATGTNADYEVLFSGTADNTTRTEGARKYSNLKFNPSTGKLTAPTLAGSISGDYLTSGYINTHPENSGTIIPFINNDIAYLLERGGSAVIKYDGTAQTVDISNVFDCSPSYWRIINPTDHTTITIELTLHKAFGYTNTVYVDFGASLWRAKNVKFEVMNSNYEGDTWTTKYENTDNSVGHCYARFSHTPTGASNAGAGFNKLRFTFSTWATATIFRIAQLGIVNYDSKGLREGFLPKDGGEMYGNIYPNTTNGANLGTSSKYWNNAYVTNINGVAVGSSPKFTDTDTKNTAGSTDTSSKIFLIGATSQATNPQTYSHDTAYVGTDGCLYSGGTKVLTAHQSITGKVDKKTTLDTYYGTCSTAAATAAKVITVTDGASNFSLRAGITIVVKFTYTNTASNPTFNVNSTGAKSVWYNTALITTGSLGYAGTANRPMQFTYDGTQWVFVGWSYDANTTYSAMSVSELTTGTATTSRVVRADYLKTAIEHLIHLQTYYFVYSTVSTLVGEVFAYDNRIVMVSNWSDNSQTVFPTLYGTAIFIPCNDSTERVIYYVAGTMDALKTYSGKIKKTSNTAAQVSWSTLNLKTDIVKNLTF